MRQFYEVYRDDEIVSPLMSQRWTKRELERQFEASLFARTVSSPPAPQMSSRLLPATTKLSAQSL